MELTFIFEPITWATYERYFPIGVGIVAMLAMLTVIFGGASRKGRVFAGVLVMAMLVGSSPFALDEIGFDYVSAEAQVSEWTSMVHDAVSN